MLETRKRKRLYGFIIDLIVLAYLMEITFRIEHLLVYKEPIKILRFLIIFGGYYIPMEYFLGKTLGKMIVGTRVVNRLGKKISLREAFIRFFSRFIPYEIFSLALGANARAWHDYLSNTYVIDDPK
ncbi:MAG: RDD family protein [Bacteroidota bacterium]